MSSFFYRSLESSGRPGIKSRSEVSARPGIKSARPHRNGTKSSRHHRNRSIALAVAEMSDSVLTSSSSNNPHACARCWGGVHHGLALMLPADKDSIAARCTIRHYTLESAQAACAKTSWCGGITRDGGIKCAKAHKMGFELSSSEVDELRTNTDGWYLHPIPSNGPDAPWPTQQHGRCARPPACIHRNLLLPAPPQRLPSYNREGALRLRTEHAREFSRHQLRSVAHRPHRRHCLAMLLGASRAASSSAAHAKARSAELLDELSLASQGRPQRVTWRPALERDNAVVSCFIASGEPFLIGRPSLGSEVAAAYLAGVRGRPLPVEMKQ